MDDDAFAQLAALLDGSQQLRTAKQQARDALSASPLDPQVLAQQLLGRLDASGQGTLVRNATFAVSERLAFAPLPPAARAPGEEEGAKRGQTLGEALGLEYHAPVSKEEWAAHPQLLRARERLQEYALQRLRELQVLTCWQAEQPRRPPARVAQLLAKAAQSGAGSEAWAAIGMNESPLSELPLLPDLVRKDLYSPLDLLVALAGHLSVYYSSDTANTQRMYHPSLTDGTQPSATMLPRSLAQIKDLPTLQHLEAPSMAWLRTFFADMRPQQMHIGVDDRVHPWFREGKVHMARALLDEGSIPLCRSFAKFGCPHGCRAQLWEVALGLGSAEEQTSDAQAEFEGLVQEVCTRQQLSDVWLSADMACVRNSEHFFLFEDVLRAVALAFQRDPRIARHCSVEPHPCMPSAAAAAAATAAAAAAAAAAATAAAATATADASSSPAAAPPASVAREGQSAHEADSSSSSSSSRGAASGSAGAEGDSGGGGAASTGAAECGVLLPQGALLLAAPLCFLYSAPARLYRMHRALYCRYWCKLHALSPLGAPAPALPVLLRTYEALLLALDPEVAAHMHHLGIPMAAVALPWLCKAFVGFLPVEEVLLLWDRVIGMDSLLPVALLAVAVVCFRRQVILSCKAGSEVIAAMADLSQLKAVPLLQAVLFQG